MDFPTGLTAAMHTLAARLVLLEEPGAEVKRLRERHGFTQEALAPLLTLTRESLSRVESGRTTPTRAFIARFTRLMTLAQGAREHYAFMEARGNVPDEKLLGQFASHLGVERAAAEEVLLAAMMSYQAKRESALRAFSPARSGAARARTLASDVPAKAPGAKRFELRGHSTDDAPQPALRRAERGPAIEENRGRAEGESA